MATVRKLVFEVTVTSFSIMAWAQAQAPAEPVIRVSVDLVVVDTQVAHKKTGRPIGGLKREDFEVFEDGVRQEIVAFSQDRLPLSIVFLFDLTDTVRPVLKPLASG